MENSEKFSYSNCLGTLFALQPCQNGVDALSEKVQKNTQFGSHVVQVLQFGAFPLDCVIAAVAHITLPAAYHFLNFFEAEDAKVLAGRILWTPITLPLKLIGGVALGAIQLLRISLTPYYGTKAVIAGRQVSENERIEARLGNCLVIGFSNLIFETNPYH